MNQLTEVHDRGDIRSAVRLLALPVLMEQLLSYLVALVDTFLAGQLGEVATQATGAVGLAGYVSWLGTLLFGLIGIGTTAIVARAWGAGRRREANRIANQAILLSAGLGVLFLVLMQPAAPWFAWLLRMEGLSGEIVIRYLRIDAVGLTFTSVTLAIAAALRGVGDMRTPMFVLGFVNIVNAVCSWLLVHGLGPIPALGVDGIVLGTLIARASGGLLMLLVLARGAGGLQLRRRQLRPRSKLAKRIVRIGLPAAADGLVLWGGHFLFLMIISQLAPGPAGETIFAAHIVGVRVEAITYLPAVAWGYAAASLVGQNLGARRPKAAMAIGHEAARQCALVGAVMTVLLFATAEPIYDLLHEEPAVGEVGAPAMRLLALFQIPVVLSIVYIQALRGAGDTRWPLLISCIGILVVRLPLAYLCGIVLDGGLVGAWAGMCGDQVIRAGLAFRRFASGRWTQTTV